MPLTEVVEVTGRRLVGCGHRLLHEHLEDLLDQGFAITIRAKGGKTPPPALAMTLATFAKAPAQHG